jgi:hypothetical protein
MANSNDEVRMWLEKHFADRGGKILELGAFDHQKNSLTGGFLRSHPDRWSGVVVEGNCMNARKLQASYAEYPNVTLVHAVLGQYSGIAVWWDDGGGEESTLSARHRDGAVARIGSRYSSLLVGTVAFGEFFRWYLTQKGQPSLVTIDLEGLSNAAAKALSDLTALEPEVVVVETDDATVMDNQRYRPALIAYPDIVFVRA